MANGALADLGWTVLRFWDFDVKEDPRHCADVIVAALEASGRRPVV